MRLLVSSDWQSEIRNLPNCEKAATNVLDICEKRNLDAVVFAGDLKEVYNPIDYRIIHFWTDFIDSLRRRKKRVLVLLGNHDRIGLYADEVSWLPILKRAGAEVYDTVGMYGLPGGRLYLFPFVGNNERFYKQVEILNERLIEPNPQQDVLIFHYTFLGASYNKTNYVIEKGIPLGVLKPERFRFCIGGDIHLGQKIGENAWYVGSPFPVDWGEANQQKFFAVVTPEKLEWVPTGIPLWYDPSVKGFKPPKSWEGSRVRLRISISRGADYGTCVAEARAIGAAQYPGAEIVVDPKIQEEEKSTVDLAKLSEAEQIKKYVESVWTDKETLPQALAYIDYRIRQTQMGLRMDLGVRFKRIQALRVLSFEEVDLDLDHPGLTVITGINKDWPGRSNGSGKSNLIQLISIALFGRTIKGQQYDAWVQEGSDDTSIVTLDWTTADGTTVRVTRTRNPVGVHLLINNEEISAGSKSTDVSKEIEQYCGFSYDMFVALMYISNEEQTFLWGTPKEKQTILARLQNLERFAAARKLVSKELEVTEGVLDGWQIGREAVKASIREKAGETTAETEITSLKTKLDQNRMEFSAIRLPEVSKLEETAQELDDRYGKLNNERIAKATQLTRLRNELATWKNLPETCPTCKQKISRDKNLITKTILNYQNTISEETRSLELLTKNNNELLTIAIATRKRYVKAYGERKAAEDRQASLQRAIAVIEEDLKRWNLRKETQATELRNLKSQEVLLNTIIESLEEDLEFIRKVESILARDGLPAYISALLCPKINRAAEYFAEKFTEGHLKVAFESTDGEIDSRIINLSGASSLSGQSSGEGGLETLITSFALRAAGVRSNLLFLDEPGDGLDESNAKAFARGIRDIGDRFGSIYLITHSQTIAAELADARVVTVTKENRVSRISNGKGTI